MVDKEIKSKLIAAERKHLRINNDLYVPASLLWIGDQTKSNLTLPFSKLSKNKPVQQCIIGSMYPYPLDPQLNTYFIHDECFVDNSFWYYCCSSLIRFYKIPAFKDYMYSNLLFTIIDDILVCIPNCKFENNYLFKVYPKGGYERNKNNFSLIFCNRKKALELLKSRNKISILQGILFRNFFLDNKDASIEEQQFYASVLDLDTIINKKNKYKSFLNCKDIVPVKMKLSKHGFLYLSFSEDISYYGLDSIKLILEHLSCGNNEKVFKEYRNFTFVNYENKIPKYISLNSCIFAINRNDRRSLIKNNKINEFRYLTAK